MKFSHVARAFDAIDRETSRTRITELLSELFSQATAEESSFLAYFSLGMLAPAHASKTLKLSTKSMTKVLARLADIDVAQATKRVKEVGEVGLFAASVRSEHDAEHTDVDVLMVAHTLHEVATMDGAGSQEQKAEAVARLIQSVDAPSACYITRGVVGTLRLGFSDMTLLDAWSYMMRGDKTLRPALEHRYNISADIGAVISEVKHHGTAVLHDAHITPGTPVRPAAAERAKTSEELFNRLGPCVAQLKLDGFRVQVHVWTDEQGERQVRFFSRNLHDMSAMFPDIAHAVKGIPADAVVFEGEAIACDPQTGHFLPFQQTVKRKRKHGVDDAAHDIPLTLYVFDVLHLDGADQFEVPHEQRRKELERLVDGCNHARVLPIDERVIATHEDLALYFDEAMADGLEGLVVKKPNAGYRPGKRNFNWIKLKRQETGSLEDTVDCVVLGYYAGTGKRAAFGIGALLVGIYNKDDDRFETIAQIGTGLKDNEWVDMKARCDEVRAIHEPHNVVCHKSLIPDVWVEPSLVCMIRADNITRSPVHSAGAREKEPGYALRFPRIMGMRSDKDATDATTPQEVEKLYLDQ